MCCHGGVVNAVLRMALRTPATGGFELFTTNTSLTELLLVRPGPLAAACATTTPPTWPGSEPRVAVAVRWVVVGGGLGRLRGRRPARRRPGTTSR